MPITLTTYILVDGRQAQLTVEGDDLKILDEFRLAVKQFADDGNAPAVPQERYGKMLPKSEAIPTAQGTAPAGNLAPKRDPAPTQHPIVDDDWPNEPAQEDLNFWNALPPGIDFTPPEPPLCPVHHVPMRPSKFDDGKFYCSAKNGDDFCKEKA